MKKETAKIWFRYLLMLLAVLLMLAVSGCSTRKVEKRNDRIKITEKGTIDRKIPGDHVSYEFPKSPKDRPRSRTETYRGKRGASVEVPFDSTGNATGFAADCPDITERETYDREMDYKLKLKQTERAFAEMAIKEGKSLLLWMTAIISAAWVIRGFFKK